MEPSLGVASERGTQATEAIGQPGFNAGGVAGRMVSTVSSPYASRPGTTSTPGASVRTSAKPLPEMPDEPQRVPGMISCPKVGQTEATSRVTPLQIPLETRGSCSTTQVLSTTLPEIAACTAGLLGKIPCCIAPVRVQPEPGAPNTAGGDVGTRQFV